MGTTKQPGSIEQDGIIKSLPIIITLNVNILNSPFKRHSVDEWTKKKKTQLYVAYRRLTAASRTQRLKVKDWKKIPHANGNQNRVRYIRQNKL